MRKDKAQSRVKPTIVPQPDGGRVAATSKQPALLEPSGPLASTLFQRIQRFPSSITSSDILQLQRTVGNQAVMRFLGKTLSRRSQAEANVNHDDGADDLAHTVVRSSNPSPLGSIKKHPVRSVVQLRPIDDPYFNKWAETTWEQYQPPGNPVRADLEGFNEEIVDAKRARDLKQPKALNLARAWIQHIFRQGFGGPGDVEDVYVAKDDQDAGGYSISQKVSGLPLLVIHAHMEKNHKPSDTSAEGGEMGPVHWKWADQQLEPGVGGMINPALYPQLLNLNAARAKRNAQIVTEYKDTNTVSKLPALLLQVLPEANIADLVLGALVSRYPTQLAAVEAYLKSLKEPEVAPIVGALQINTGASQIKPSDSAKDILIRAQLLVYLAGGRRSDEAILKRNELTALDQTRIDDLRPVKLQTGEMEIKPMLGSIDINAANRGLNQVKLNLIRGIFDRIMGTEVKYNSAAVPLQFISDVRKVREVTPAAKMGVVFDTFARSSDESIDTYGAADCVAMAQKVKQELAGIGIYAQVIGSNGGNYLNEIPDPTNVGRGRVKNQAAHDYAVYSHASVVVPYQDEAGVPKAIHMESGMGPAPKFFKSYDSLFAAEAGLSKKKYLLDKPVVDPEALQKMHIKCKWKMYLSDSADQSRKTFIDLAEGVVLVSQWKDPEFVKSLPGAKINFNEILADPDKEVTITINEKDVKMSNATSLTLFLSAIQKDFGLPASFVDDMLYLASHVKEYSEEILLAPINAVRATMDVKTKALATRDHAAEIDQEKGDPYQKSLAAANIKIAAAAEFVQQGKTQEALAQYTAALKIFQTMVHVAHSTNVAGYKLDEVVARNQVLLEQIGKITVPAEKAADLESAKTLIAQGDQYTHDAYAKKAQLSYNGAEQILKNILTWKPKADAEEIDFSFDLFGSNNGY